MIKVEVMVDVVCWCIIFSYCVLLRLVEVLFVVLMVVCIVVYLGCVKFLMVSVLNIGLVNVGYCNVDLSVLCCGYRVGLCGLGWIVSLVGGLVVGCCVVWVMVVDFSLFSLGCLVCLVLFCI